MDFPNLPAAGTLEEEQLKVKLTEMENRLIEVRKEVTQLKNYKEELENSISVANNVVTIWKNNQSIINLAVGATALISPVIMYRSCLNIFTKHYIPELPKRGSVNNISDHRAQIHRLQLLRKFNMFAIPLICTYYLGINRYHKAFNVLGSGLNIGPGTSSTTSSFGVLLFIKKLPNWLKIIALPILIWFGVWLIPLVIKLLSPALYSYLSELIAMGPYWLTYPLLIWQIVYIIFLFVELYIIVMLTQDSHSIKMPNYSPKFVIKWFNRLKSRSRLRTGSWILRSYVKIILFFIIILTIYVCLGIYFNVI